MADLLQAIATAPKHGLNAKALILAAAQARDSDDSDGEQSTRPTKRQRRGPAEIAAAAAAKHGPNFLDAVDVKQRPLVAYNSRSKIPRINRQTVLNKLAGQHLVLAALRRHPPLRAPAAAADSELKREAFGAALAQELELFGRCGGAQVYQNLAARVSASQWQAAELEHLYTPPQSQQQQQQEARAARQQDLQGQQQQQQQQARQPTQQPPRNRKPAPAVPLVEAELDWDAALPVPEGDDAAVLGPCQNKATAAAAADAKAAAAGSAGPSSIQDARPSACTSAQTFVGEDSLQPLPHLPALEGLPPAQATPGGATPAARLPVAAAPEAATGASAARRTAALAPADGPIAAQVALFVRAELHGLLKRGQIGAEAHAAVCAKCTSKVMQRHQGATSADFLVSEASSVRALVRQYVKHLGQAATSGEPAAEAAREGAMPGG